MKLKQLEAALQDVAPFENPNNLLEQYPTSPHIGSRIIYTAATSFADISGKCICDLGCGTGRLTIGALLMDASHVISVDVDASALAQTAATLEEFDLDDSSCDLILADVTSPWFKSNDAVRGSLMVDTVIMNPPFGTRTKGIDVKFLEVAFAIAQSAVYSLHKTSTREFLVKKSKSLGWNANVLAQLRFDIPAMYKHHKKESVDIEVDLIRFSPL
ncbi:hypothetical protein SmJEL517_g01391 [Synchytrium microbalum]|uniref:Methyltransferase small domain-containing protein n=1 Tax=Synchytrium microbalum TaxID=1806994 RepID=A0A507CAQ8_9FUNG|nr:uncharacterized protein SmJEL517_g01391 [Synchytrium microbalum]TPX36541.1 hypothetical protein SmJEL517_g01391 [Synchytrium microbalum]